MCVLKTERSHVTGILKIMLSQRCLFSFFEELLARPELTEDELKELKNVQNNIQNQIKKRLRYTTYHYRPLQ